MKELLKSYLRDEISKSAFSASICEIHGLEVALGRARFLRLKHGDKITTLELFQKRNDCVVCNDLYTADLAGSDNIRKALDERLSTSKIEWAEKPKWYIPHLANKNPYGAQGFFKCSSCGSIIDVCEPERMYRGCCEVIG